MNKTVKITKIKIPTIIIADNAPVLPNSKVEAKALGISATIPEKIISDIPFPTPRKVICSLQLFETKILWNFFLNYL